MTKPDAGGATATSFWRSVGVVLSGSVVAQAIPLIGSLVIARIFVPAEFGLFSAWLGMVMLAAVVVTARFEMALAVEADGAPRTVAVVATLAMVVLVGSLLALVAGLLYWSGSLPGELALWMVVWWAPAAALVGVTHTWQAWAAADGSYRHLSSIRIAQAVVLTIAQIAAGLVAPTAQALALGHVLGLIGGIAVATLVMPLRFSAASNRTLVCADFTLFWRRQRRFPLFALPADAINSAAGQIPLLLIATRFGAEASGLYALTLRVLGAPIGLLGAAVLDVFKRNAAVSYRNKGHCRDEYLRTFWLLAVGALLLVVGVVVLADRVFVVAFGEPWRRAGTIAVWLVPMFAMRFVASPLSYVFYIAGKQHVDLIWQCALLSVTLWAFLSAANFKEAVLFYSAGYAALYVVYALMSYRFSRGRP